jgi:hypothetical protein
MAAIVLSPHLKGRCQFENEDQFNCGRCGAFASAEGVYSSRFENHLLSSLSSLILIASSRKSRHSIYVTPTPVDLALASSNKISKQQLIFSPNGRFPKITKCCTSQNATLTLAFAASICNPPRLQSSSSSNMATSQPWSSVQLIDRNIKTTQRGDPSLYSEYEVQYTSPGHLEEASDHIKSFKNSHVCREQGAGVKALSLMNEAFGQQQEQQSEPVCIDEPEPVQALKSDSDINRERCAKARALTLLNQVTAGGEAPSLGRDAPLSIKQAAALRYEHACVEKAKRKVQQKADMEKYGKPVPVLVAPVPKEKLAITTRARKPKTAEDVRDPETIAGMKCQLDLDREQLAQQKALRLLSEGCIL